MNTVTVLIPTFMGKKPNEEQLMEMRKAFPLGTRIRLVHMNDVQAPPSGTKGTVMGVDDIGSIIVKWDNGSSLDVICQGDTVQKL